MSRLEIALMCRIKKVVNGASTLIDVLEATAGLCVEKIAAITRKAFTAGNYNLLMKPQLILYRI